jgi:hypothetical protein
MEKIRPGITVKHRVFYISFSASRLHRDDLRFPA